MESLKAKLTAWYDAHIVAAWYRSTALWIGVLAGLVQFVPDWIQTLLDNFDLGASALHISDGKTKLIQAVLLFVVLPIAKAVRQESMEKARIAQEELRAKADTLSPPVAQAIVSAAIAVAATKDANAAAAIPPAALTTDIINAQWAEAQAAMPPVAPTVVPPATGGNS